MSRNSTLAIKHQFSLKTPPPPLSRRSTKPAKTPRAKPAKSRFLPYESWILLARRNYAKRKNRANKWNARFVNKPEKARVEATSTMPSLLKKCKKSLRFRFKMFAMLVKILRVVGAPVPWKRRRIVRCAGNCRGSESKLLTGYGIVRRRDESKNGWRAPGVTNSGFY